ncbi:MAG: hypothetical protein ACREUT_22580, partial [Steroidobacteraceae bacterium]
EDLLNTNRNVLIGLGLLTLDIFGTATVVGGLPCTPTSPGSLDVAVGPGRIYALEPVDESAYSSLAADTTDDIVKQGINLAATDLSCPAPATAGYSINYLIEAIYEDEDADEVVLSYYNASNPGSPYSGPGGDASAQATRRAGIVSLQAKAGVPAPTGTQTTPAVDSGYVPLYIVTVAHGESAIVSGDISVYPGAPFITGAFLTEPLADERYLQLSGGTLTGALTGTSASFAGLTISGTSAQSAAVLTSGLVASARLGTGTASSTTFLAGNQAFSQVPFSSLSGSIANGQVPASAVTQWQASLSIAGSQITGSIGASLIGSGLIASARIGAGTANSSTFARGDQSWAAVTFANLSGSIANGQVPAGAVTQWQASLSIGAGQISGAVAEANKIASNGGYATFNWSGQSGQPSWLWGSNDGNTFYVWNPADFSVSELQGYAPSTSAVPNTVAVRDGSAYLWANYFNQSSGQNENPSISQVMVTNNTDGFLRKASLAYFLEQAMLSGAVTLQADPGGTPGSGAAGSLVLYY